MRHSLLAFVIDLIEDRFPHLRLRRMPFGGYVYCRRDPWEFESCVHIIRSPMPRSAVHDVVCTLHEVHPELGMVCREAYIDLLLQFNGANLFYPDISLWGFQAPREIYVQGGVPAVTLHTPNWGERHPWLKPGELMIGAMDEPAAVITIDRNRVIRLRSRSESRLLRQFPTFEELFLNILGSRAGSGPVAGRPINELHRW